MSQYQARTVGLQERYSVTRSLSGGHPIICTVGTLRAPIASDALSSRIDELLSELPLLRSCLTDLRSIHPRWIPMSPPPSSVDILHIPQDTGGSREAILERELKGFASTVDLEKGPLWRVTIYPEHVVLAVHHTIIDGKGTFNLFYILLSKVVDWDLVTGDLGPNALPPTSDASLKLAPPVGFLLPIVWRELVLPKLPLSSKWNRAKPFWPFAANKGKGAHHIRILSIPGLSQLKKAAKERRVATVHGLLHAVFLAALFEADKLLVTTKSPLSTRVPKQHGLCTGNYVGAINYDAQLKANLSFWEMARAYSNYIASPKTKQRALYEIGMLAYIPDTPPTREDERTGWERFWESKTAYRHSLAVSNLGQLPGNEIITDVVWAQPPSSAALTLDVIGFAESVTVSVGWRDGKVTEDVVKRFIDRVLAIAKRLSDSGLDQSVTLAQVAAVKA